MKQASTFLVRVHTGLAGKTEEVVLLEQFYGHDEPSARHDAALLNELPQIPGREPLKLYRVGWTYCMPMPNPGDDWFFTKAEVVEFVPGLPDA